ncbi:putative conserved serine proline-rich protein [Phaeomoniella chlamydospora]|uniref:Putative conserved serine proline-rich protein n=1 Tax=Phaeomoniella chlamydospora TaxID=158046 RepID=A0A0G2E8R5_PHACM|nr:putative conserved serine proline-rich protein [Phaeomoniella chlamydospora]
MAAYAALSSSMPQALPTPTGHTAGIYADMTLDGPEIGTLVVVVDRAKNLPNIKKVKQNPYCAMRLGKEAKKTETDRRGGQTPRWDQELRFTVHESPDYYKLKVSVFNDDKKTELISEGWIDLSQVIIPGGGQSDNWQELQYRGKYAGEIRIELTYYDTRPRDETVVEKRKESERVAKSSRNNTPSKTRGVEGPRHFGPREISRRPLPADPTGSSPAPAPGPSPIAAPVPRPGLHEHAHSSPGPYAAQGYNPSPSFRDPRQPHVHEQTHANSSAPSNGRYGDDPFDFTLPPRNHSTDILPEPENHDNQYKYSSQHDNYSDQGDLPVNTEQDPFHIRQQYQPQPLPLPPAPYNHDQNERRHSPPTKKFSLDDRSPLQSLERQYDPRLQPNPSPVASRGRSQEDMYGTYNGPSPHDEYSQRQARPRAQSQEAVQSRENFYRSEAPAGYPAQTRTVADSQPVVLGGTNYRRSPSPLMSDREREIYGSGGRGAYPAYEQPSPTERRPGMRTSTAGVPVVKPRAISPDARGTTRKSVSPRPTVQSDQASMSSIPFSPDSYDVFNPTSNSASAVNGPEQRYETPEAAMEAARQREVEKLREQGPIIGNDGRIIDPSDHLPTDTWAPEPERKKKPEVVIRFKTGGSTPRTPNSYGSSPTAVRPHSMTTPTYSTPPAPVPINSPPGGSSPPRMGRNRLQKPGPPPRPVPNQPYQQHTHSSPAVPMSSQHTPSPKFEPPRHSVSEYPLREHPNYRSGYGAVPARGGPPIPAKIPLQQPVYSTSGSDPYGSFGRVDSLAAEMSTIDIGMGNGGRYGTPRTRRNY